MQDLRSERCSNVSATYYNIITASTVPKRAASSSERIHHFVAIFDSIDAAARAVCGNHGFRGVRDAR
jgi:hypothetical protein